MDGSELFGFVSYVAGFATLLLGLLFIGGARLFGRRMPRGLLLVRGLYAAAMFCGNLGYLLFLRQFNLGSMEVVHWYMAAITLGLALSVLFETRGSQFFHRLIGSKIGFTTAWIAGAVIAGLMGLFLMFVSTIGRLMEPGH